MKPLLETNFHFVMALDSVTNNHRSRNRARRFHASSTVCWNHDMRVPRGIINFIDCIGMSYNSSSTPEFK